MILNWMEMARGGRGYGGRTGREEKKRRKRGRIGARSFGFGRIDQG